MLSDRLKFYRLERGLSKYRLAQLCGVTDQQLGNIERGLTANPRIDTLRKIATALGVPLVCLTNGDSG